MSSKIVWIKVKENNYSSNCSGCGCLIKSKTYYLEKHSGKCIACSHKKVEFYHVFKRLQNTAKTEKHHITLTFNEYLNFTKIPKCHYCSIKIPWQPYRYSEGKYTKGGGYFLDRKDNTKGYEVDNCVVCCTDCNIAKGNRYSYEDWFGMTGYLRAKR